jgi:hypothetical protein
VKLSLCTLKQEKKGLQSIINQWEVLMSFFE